MPRFDILRRKVEIDVEVGGVAVTATAIETRYIDLQHINKMYPFVGAEAIKAGGLQREAIYHGFAPKETDVKEQDILTSDSGTTRYQVMFVEDIMPTHIEVFAKKVT